LENNKRGDASQCIRVVKNDKLDISTEDLIELGIDASIQ
jgi:hypothetical protein